jgi:hypothetical protein
MSIMRQGWERLAGQKRVIFWAYLLNLFAGLVAGRIAAAYFGATLDRSLTSQRLLHGDIGVFIDFLQQPGATLGPLVGASWASAIVFAIFMLFYDGGVIASYRGFLPMTMAEFFGACGAAFWRFVRLMGFMIIALIPVGIVAAVLQSVPGALYDRGKEHAWLYTGLAAWVITWLLAAFVRLWFDMAQVRAVVEEEFAMRKTLFRAGGQLLRDFRRLYGIYLALSVTSFVVTFVGIWLWLKVPAERTFVSFVIGQVIVLGWIIPRFWQRAAETAWYESQPLQVAQPVAAAASASETPVVPSPA